MNKVMRWLAVAPLIVTPAYADVILSDSQGAAYTIGGNPPTALNPLGEDALILDFTLTGPATNNVNPVSPADQVLTNPFVGGPGAGVQSALELNVNGTQLENFDLISGGPTISCDGRRADYSATTVGNFTVTRTVIGNAGELGVVYLDSFTNNSGSASALNAAYLADHDIADAENSIFTELRTTTNGNTVFESSDTWAIVQRTGNTSLVDPKVGVGNSGPGAPVVPTALVAPIAGVSDDLSWTFSTSVAGGSTVSFFQKVAASGVAQTLINGLNGFAATAFTVGETPAGGAASCLASQEVNQVRNFAVANPFLCGKVPATIVGTTGNDVIIGTAGADRIKARPGNDSVDAGNGDDFVCGGLGGDDLNGGLGNDVLRGGPGDDSLDGDAGTDTLRGGKGTSDNCTEGETVFGCEVNFGS